MAEQPMRVLIVEAEVKMAGVLRRGLREDGISADVAMTAEEALAVAGAGGHDAIVLDATLNGADGFAVCRRLRERGIWAPVLMLTGDRRGGRDAGADDVLAKPFSSAQLVSQLRMLADRDGPRRRPGTLRVGDLALDPASSRVTRAGRDISLSPRELALLEAFMHRPGDVLNRAYLLERVWEYDFEGRSNVVDVYIRYLREKIDRPFGVTSLETVRGAGYRLRADGGDR